MHNIPHTLESRKKMSDSHTGVPLYHKRRPSKLVNGEFHWRCGSCLKYYPYSNFYKDKRTILGIKNQCKRCHSKTAIKSRDVENYNAKKIEYQSNRRARIAKSKGNFTNKDWAQLLSILGKKCLCCGYKGNIQRDHIKPISKGGLHHARNIQPLCRKCNEKKQAKYIDYRPKHLINKIKSVWVVEFERVKP